MARESKNVKTNLRVRRYRRIRYNLDSQQRNVNNRMSQNNSQNVQATMPESEILPGDMKLRLWALKHNITRNALTDLLKILITFGLTWLPSDARALLQTKQNIEIKELANGHVWYSGIRHNLCEIFKSINRNVAIALDFNFDGIPLFNSSKHEFWPILAKIHGEMIHSIEYIQAHTKCLIEILLDFPQIKPFIICVWYGSGKPNPANDFLSPFIEELIDLIKNGIIINGYRIAIKTRCFICDTPARSLLKG